MHSTREELVSDIIFHGPLADQFGKSRRFAVAGPKELLQALEFMYPDFVQVVYKSAVDGVYHALKVDDEWVTLGNSRSLFRNPRKVIEFVPIPEGGAPLIGIIVVLAAVASLAMRIYMMVSAPPPFEMVDTPEGYSFGGATNTVRTGVAIPILYGQHMVGSATVSVGLKAINVEGIYKIGRDQELKVVDLVSEGPIEGFATTNPRESVYLDESPMTSLEEDGEVNYRLGDGNQSEMAEYASTERTTRVGVEIPEDETIIRQTTIGAVIRILRINLEIPFLLKASSKGEKPGRINFTIRITDTDSGRIWSETKSVRAVIKSKRTFSYEFNISNYVGPFEIKVKQQLGGRGDAQLFWGSFTEIGEHTFSYPYSAIIGLKLRASNFNSVPTRAYEMKGRVVRIPSNYDPVAKTYAGSWDGTFQASEAYTNNPVWCWLDLLTSDRYGLGDYVADADIDMWSLYETAQYCDGLVPDGRGGYEPRYQLDHIMNQMQEGWNWFTAIASNFAAKPFWNGEAVTLQQDRPSNSVASFNEMNVADGIFNYSDAPLRSKFNRIIVRYNEVDNFYEPDTVIVENRPSINKLGPRVRSVTAVGCVHRSQATRLGLSILETELLSDSISFSTGVEGSYLFPGRVFDVTDPRRYNDIDGGRTVVVETSQVQLDHEVEIEPGETYAIDLVMEDNEEVIAAPGNASSIVLSEDLASGDAQLAFVWEDLDADGVYETRRQPSAYSIATRTLSLTPIAAGSGNRNYHVEYPRFAHSSNISNSPGVTNILELSTPIPAPLPRPQGRWVLTTLGTTTKQYRCVSVKQRDELAQLDITGIPYDPDKYSRIESGIIIEDPDPDLLPPDLLGVAPPPPIGLQVEAQLRLTEIGMLPVVVVSWADPIDNETISGYRVTWSVSASEYETSRLVRDTEFAITPAPYGQYFIRVSSEQTITRKLSEAARAYFVFTEGDVPMLGAHVTGLEIEDRANNEWVGRDLRFQWRINYETVIPLAVEDLDQPGEQTFNASDFLAGYHIIIRDRDTLTIVREVEVHPGTSYTYTFEMQIDDGGPRRELLVAVAARDRLDRDGEFARLSVQNEAPALPTLVDKQETGAGFFLRLATAALDPDFQGYIVWASPSSGFDLDETTVVFKGYVDGYIRIPVASGLTYYFRYAAYDAFTADPDLLNVSVEDSIEVSLVVDPQVIVDSAVIGDAQIDNLSASKISGGVLNVDVITARALRAEKFALGSGDNLISDPYFYDLTVHNGGFLDLWVNDGGGSGVWGVETSVPLIPPRAAKFTYGGDELTHAEVAFNAQTVLGPSGHAPAYEGDTFYLEFECRYVGPAPSGPFVDAMIRFHEGDGTQIGPGQAGDAVGDTVVYADNRAFVIAEAPANTAYATFIARCLHGEAAGVTAVIDRVYARRMVHTLMVEDDAINNRISASWSLGTFSTMGSGDYVSVTAHKTYATGWCNAGNPPTGGHTFAYKIFDEYITLNADFTFLRVIFTGDIVGRCSTAGPRPEIALFALVDDTTYFVTDRKSLGHPLVLVNWTNLIQTWEVPNWTDGDPMPSSGRNFMKVYVMAVPDAGLHRVRIFLEDASGAYSIRGQDCRLLIEEAKR
jgi:predicted phage tail protein